MKKIILGTMQFYWTTDRKQSDEVLGTYFELGGREIDTADLYPNWVKGFRGGETESLIGEWIKDKNRADLFLTSKVRGRVWDAEDGEGLSRKHITQALDKSLMRLKTDYLDLYLAHWPDEKTSLEETIETFKELIRVGKIKDVGFSNYLAPELKKILKLGQEMGLTVKRIQAYYNLIDRKNFEEKLLPLVREFKVEVTPFGPLANGFLSGVYRPGKIPGHARAEFVKEKMTERNFRILEVLDKLAIKYSKTVGQISLAWLLSKDFISGIVVGADSKPQIEENYQALSLRLEEMDIQLLDKISSE